MKEKKVEFCIIDGLPFSVKVMSNHDVVLTNIKENKTYKMYSSTENFKCI